MVLCCNGQDGLLLFLPVWWFQIGSGVLFCALENQKPWWQPVCGVLWAEAAGVVLAGVGAVPRGQGFYVVLSLLLPVWQTQSIWLPGCLQGNSQVSVHFQR